MPPLNQSHRRPALQILRNIALRFRLLVSLSFFTSKFLPFPGFPVFLLPLRLLPFFSTVCIIFFFRSVSSSCFFLLFVFSRSALFFCSTPAPFAFFLLTSSSNFLLYFFHLRVLSFFYAHCLFSVVFFTSPSFFRLHFFHLLVLSFFFVHCLFSVFFLCFFSVFLFSVLCRVFLYLCTSATRLLTPQIFLPVLFGYELQACRCLASGTPVPERPYLSKVPRHIQNRIFRQRYG